ncbi:pantoate--beta-alanine ligase [Acidisphaera sp. L21]|uniref:pantoate--beta-alanine ligase n=1 Tax=Acidisphaera sp. L21 TaxID=1641851 RepID=UPI00131AEDCE|nr:pantoate--beta-alanine ligase [Acidisphaera sp. L21]
MQIARTRTELASVFGPEPRALVPTMGALHAGHLALVAAARQECPVVVTSIFINPLQFSQTEDLSRYPRDEAGDLAALEGAGCDVVWLPGVDTMYPPGEASVIEIAGPALGFEGAARPGHFRGVATVVAKLFGQVQPTHAFFGEKDWQQLQVVTRMAADLCLPVTIHGVPTLREADGLAMSSRNRFLSAAERATAPVLHQILRATAAALALGGDATPILADAQAGLRNAGLQPDYLALIAADTMAPLPRLAGPARLVTAARLGSVRLLDNIAVP